MPNPLTIRMFQALCALVLVVTCAGSPVFAQLTVPGSPRVPDLPRKHYTERHMAPGFDWSMPDRYGPNVDANDNGIVDLPNIRDYVLNRPHPVNKGNGCACLSPDPTICDAEPARFKVSFTTHGSVTAGHDSRPKTFHEMQLERENFRRRFGRDPIFGAMAPERKPDPEFEWFFFELNTGTFVARRTGRTQDVCLAEGPHRVTLAMRQGDEVQTIVRTADITDQLIVVLGDSFAAGEGAPEALYDFEVRHPNGIFKQRPNNALTEPFWTDLNMIEGLTGSPVLWADDGLRRSPQRVELTYSISSDRTADRRLIVKNATPFVRTGNKFRLPNGKFLRPLVQSEQVRAEHRISHRSSFTHGSQLAIELEKASQRSSVTFINLAQTGATIETGMLNSYWGAKNEIPAHQFEMAPQLDQLGALAKGRHIDDVYMSIGGNDVGFAYLITALMVGSESINDFGQIWNMVKTGDWGDFGFDQVFKGALEDEETGEFPQVAGLDGLSGAYEDLAEGFDALETEGQSIGRVTLIAPPYFGSALATGWQNLSDKTSVMNLKRPSDLSARYCAENIDPKGGGLDLVDQIVTDFSPLEFRWVDQQIFPKLVQKMRDAAEDHGWRIVEQGDLPGRHGICGTPAYREVDFAPTHPVSVRAAAPGSGRAWYRNSREAAILQAGKIDTNLGMFHPNEFGYAHVRELIKAQHPAMGLEFNNAAYADPDDSIGEVSTGPGFFGNSRTVTLRSPQDVQVLRSRVGRDRTLIFRVENSEGAQLRLHLFAENGALLASTAPEHQVDLDALKAVAQQFKTGTSEGAFETGVVVQPFNRNTSIKTALGEQLLRFTSDRKRTVYLAVTDARNVWIDPVTGAGDDWSLEGEGGSIKITFVE